MLVEHEILVFAISDSTLAKWLTFRFNNVKESAVK